MQHYFSTTLDDPEITVGYVRHKGDCAGRRTTPKPWDTPDSVEIVSVKLGGINIICGLSPNTVAVLEDAAMEHAQDSVQSESDALADKGDAKAHEVLEGER